MYVEISLRNQQKMQYLIELLRSLDFVESVTIRPELTQTDAMSVQPSTFDQFYGRAKSGQTIEQLDSQLQQLRTEWTRDF